MAHVCLKAWVGNREDRSGRLVFGERRLENGSEKRRGHRKVKKSREDRKIEDEASLEDREGIYKLTGRKEAEEN